jgi:hypothetical protein
VEKVNNIVVVMSPIRMDTKLKTAPLGRQRRRPEGQANEEAGLYSVGVVVLGGTNC